MREIKFRAWNIQQSKMIEVRKIDFIFYGNPSVISDVSYPDDENILMQYTGLKDRNGKEIYEGDIVKDVIGVGNIIYFETYTSFMILYKNEKLHNLNIDLEVIGNIYENKDLLK